MPSINKSHRVILLVEDDPGDQELTRRALEEHFDSLDLRIANDGEEAIDYLLKRGSYQDSLDAPRPDLILLDLNMPKIDGKQVLAELKKQQTLKGIPVVVLTTSQRDEDIVQSYALGCNSFITKPVTAEGFWNAMKQLSIYWFELVHLPTD